jgi:hypothetical protein
MFKSKKTKIISTPVEEVLEVKAEKPQKQELVSIDFARVEGSVSYITFGTLVDYDGQEYEFEWDTTQNRLSRLTGSSISQFVWNSAVETLSATFKQPESSLESELEPFIADQVNSLSITLTKGLKDLDDKIERIASVKTQTVVRTELPKMESAPQRVQNIEEQETDPDEDQIRLNALKFLQESQDEDLGVDYLSL